MLSTDPNFRGLMNQNTFVVRFLSFLCCVAFAAMLMGADDPGEMLGKAMTDFSSGNFEQAVDGFRSLHSSNPKDDIALYMLAAALAKSGHPDDSLIQLKALASSGSCLEPREKTFSDMTKLPEYQSLVQKLAAAQTSRGQTAFTIPEPDFFPEGIAYDAENQALFVGSVHKRKIVRIGISQNKVEPFVESKQDGLMSVLGMKVDSKNHQLWAVSVADPTMQDYSEKEDAGKNAVVQYDVKGKTLLHKYPLPGGTGHYLNDLALDAAGGVYVTDSGSGEIFTIAPGGKELEVFLPAGSFSALNGIAMSADGKMLYVADTLKGIYAITPGTKAITRLSVGTGIETAGIDGLYFYKQSLIGIFNMMQPGRIMKFDLDDTGLKVVRSTVLECGNPSFDDPTTATIAGDALYLIANSQLQRINPDGTPFPMEQLKPIKILRLKIAAP